MPSIEERLAALEAEVFGTTSADPTPSVTAEIPTAPALPVTDSPGSETPVTSVPDVSDPGPQFLPDGRPAPRLE